MPGQQPMEPPSRALTQRLVRVCSASSSGYSRGPARDPFAASDVYAVRAALRVCWAAELARLAGAASLEHWAAATAEWEKIDRPHDSAYCRWRGAQAALAAGQASTATKLLRRAERDAREHVPQFEAIRATVGSGLRRRRDAASPGGIVR